MIRATTEILGSTPPLMPTKPLINKESIVAMSNATDRTTAEKLKLFASCFSGLKHVYGTYDPATGRAWQAKAPVTSKVLMRHLRGEQPYGVYLLNEDKTLAAAADFDSADTSPPLEFIRQARQYGLGAYLERSKSKGWHVWLFFPQPGVLASKARMVVNAILADIGAPDTEVFPKQDRLVGDGQFGNFINAPLFGKLVFQGRTVFVDPDAGLRPYPNQWDVLAGVRRITEAQLDEIIEINELGREPADTPKRTSQPSRPDTQGSFGLPPCAQKMLAGGVTDYQRVACFRLASHLRKAGLPNDLAMSVLKTWAQKNRPVKGKRIITQEEIQEQTHSAYSRDYAGCGCEDPAIAPYCEPSCPLRQAASRSGATEPSHAQEGGVS